MRARNGLAPILSGFLVIVPAFSQAATPAVSCQSLAKLALPEATITLAQAVDPIGFKMPVSQPGPGGGPGGPGGPGGQGGPPRGMTTPSKPSDTTNHIPFCRIAATLRPSGDSDIKVGLRWAIRTRS